MDNQETSLSSFERILRYSDMIGQNMQKNIILNKLALGNLPKLLLFEGTTGTGKSTLAELVAMSLGCEDNKPSKGQACLKCSNCRDTIRALRTDGKSTTMVKINMPEFVRKDDVSELIKGMFKLQASTLHHTTYILEEFDGIKQDLQMLFLEEVSRIQDGVTVIICTMNKVGVLDALVSRAKIQLKFSKLNREECKVLINKHCHALGVELTELDKEFLINATKSSARDIVNVLHSLHDVPNFSSIMRDYFKYVNVKVYTAYFQQCTADGVTFISWLDDVSSTIDLVDFWNGMREFIRNAIFYKYGRGGVLFTQGEKVEVTKTIGKFNEAMLQQLLEYSYQRVKNVDDAEFRLLQMRKIIMGNKTLREHKEEAQRENRVADRNAREVASKSVNGDTGVKQVNKLDLSMLADLSGNDKVYNG